MDPILPAPPAPKKPPRRYTPARGAKVCQLILEGYTLRQIERKAGMPHRSTVLRWAADDALAPGFRDQYARAKAVQTEALAEELLEICDDGTNDWRDREVRDGWHVREVDQEAINRSRLRVDTRKWLLAKLLPKVYGEKLEHAGAIGVDLTLKGLLQAIDGKTRGLPPPLKDPA
jgi:terminase small subunit-like protein